MKTGIKTYIWHKLPVKMKCWIQSKRIKKYLNIKSNSFVHSGVQILGLENVVIGENSCICDGSWLNVNNREQGVSIKIGDNCFVGRDNFFSSGKCIEFGDYCLTAIGCRFICSSHVIDNPLLPYIASGTTTHQSIKLGVNCFIGADVSILGDVSVGHGSVIGANSVVLNNVPAFSVAIGSPAKVVKRYSFSKNEWVGVSELDECDLNENPNEIDYLEILKKNKKKVDIPWIVAGADLGNL